MYFHYRVLVRSYKILCDYIIHMYLTNQMVYLLHSGGCILIIIRGLRQGLKNS